LPAAGADRRASRSRAGDTHTTRNLRCASDLFTQKLCNKTGDHLVALKKIGPIIGLAAGGFLLVALALPGAALAQTDERTVTESGYSVADDAVWNFFSQYGGAGTFGEPISREFMLFGKPTQVFQNAALQVQTDGSVQAMQLTDPALLPSTSLNGLTVPAADPELAFIAPTPDQPNYAARLQVFVQGSVPDTFSGQPVQFLSTYNSDGGAAVWGLPTSTPKTDPNNPNFIYQRFQNGILFYDGSSASTQPLPLGQTLKSLLTSDSAVLRLAAQSGDSDLSQAFVPDSA
jgi:hypothetical protein